MSQSWRCRLVWGAATKSCHHQWPPQPAGFRAAGGAACQLVLVGCQLCYGLMLDSWSAFSFGLPIIQHFLLAEGQALRCRMSWCVAV